MVWSWATSWIKWQKDFLLMFNVLWTATSSEPGVQSSLSASDSRRDQHPSCWIRSSVQVNTVATEELTAWMMITSYILDCCWKCCVYVYVIPCNLWLTASMPTAHRDWVNFPPYRASHLGSRDALRRGPRLNSLSTPRRESRCVLQFLAF